MPPSKGPEWDQLIILSEEEVRRKCQHAAAQHSYAVGETSVIRI